MKTALLLLGLMTALTQAFKVQDSFSQVTPVMEEIFKEAHQAFNHTFLVRRGLESEWYKYVFGF